MALGLATLFRFHEAGFIDHAAPSSPARPSAFSAGKARRGSSRTPARLVPRGGGAGGARLGASAFARGGTMRVGLIGVGAVGRIRRTALAKLPGCTPSAVHDLNLAAAKELAGEAHVFDSG